MSFDPYIFTCCECGEPIDSRVQVVFQKIEGWDKKRAQGGSNHIYLRRPLNEFMCASCMALHQADLDPRQLTID